MIMEMVVETVLLSVSSFPWDDISLSAYVVIDVSSVVLSLVEFVTVAACGVARVLLVVLVSVLLSGGIVVTVLVVLACRFHMSHQVVRAVILLLVWHPLS